MMQSKAYSSRDASFLHSRPFAFEQIRLHCAPDHFFLEPLLIHSKTSEHAFEPKSLIISRTSSNFELTSDSPSLEPQHTTQEIFGVVGIISLLATRYLIVITSRKLIAKFNGEKIYIITGVRFIPFEKNAHLSLTPDKQRDEERYLALLKRMLRTEHFYFSYSLDITNRMQNLYQMAEDEARGNHIPIWERVDQRFFWNRYLSQDLIAHKLEGWVLPIMLGFVQVENGCTIKQISFEYGVISRRNTKRAGTRFHVRGVDDAGNVANNVETEQLLLVTSDASDERSSRDSYAGVLYAFVQTRGSIPIYWDQSPNIKYAPRPVIVADDKKNSEAFRQHMEGQRGLYGEQVLVNLVNQKGPELTLAQAYENQVKAYGAKDVRYVAFDFHHHCRKMKWENLSLLLQQLKNDLHKHSYFLSAGEEVKAQQAGVVRTNCMDNLDRTNVVQNMLARYSLDSALRELGVFTSPTDSILNYPEFKNIFNNVWANNADMISTQYAGTGALKTDYTRTGKRTVQGALNDGINSLARYYLNNFIDGFRQDAYDLFLGNYVVVPSARSPFRKSARPVATLTFLLALVVGVTMLISSSVYSESWWSRLVSGVFWAGALFGSFKLLIWFGRDIVDKPQLGVKIKQA